MSFLGPRGWPAALPPAHPGRRAALGCGLLAALLAAPLCRPPPARPPHTDAANLTAFVGQLRQRGVPLHAVWGARDGASGYHVYLTEDPGATWRALQSRPRSLQHLDRWRGTVCVEQVLPVASREDELADWGANGRRIGPFLLFGDARLLRRIEGACR